MSLLQTFPRAYRHPTGRAVGRVVAPTCEALETRALLSLSLVADINSDAVAVPTSAPVEFNGAAYFNRGGALWKSVLATAETTQVAAFVYPPSHLTPLGDSLLFFASNGQYGLWKVDGTTGAVSQVRQVTFIERVDQPAPAPAVFGGALYFMGNGGTGGYELWRSDGTTAGTTLFKEIYPGAPPSSPSDFAEMGGRLYFAATTPAGSRRLWRTDGTDAGTVRVDNAPLFDGPRAVSSLRVVGGNTLYFAAEDAAHGKELWKTNGTAAGTTLVQDLRPGPADSNPTSLTESGGRLFFSALDAAVTRRLWVTVPAAAGGGGKDRTFLLGAGTDPQGLTPFGGRLLFSAADPINGRELWRSDGTDTGTAPLADLNPGTASSSPDALTPFGPHVYFAAHDGARGRELWRTDGTAAGTALVRDVVPGERSSRPTTPAVVGGRLLFFARSGSQLWKSDGTEAGTSLVHTFTAQPASSSPSFAVPFGDVVLFAADDGEGRNGLWKSDGTAEGTVFLAPARPGATPFVAEGARVAYFGVGGSLWKTDGTPAGTVRVKQLQGAPSQFVEVDGTLFFAAADLEAGEELWRSDGTAEVTVRVKDINPDREGSSPKWLTNVSGRLYFVAFNRTLGTEVWTSDGTAEGTVLVKDLNPANNGQSIFDTVRGPALLSAYDGSLFFVATDGAGGMELYRTDGTADGTRRVRDINPGAGDGVWPYGLAPVVLDGALYFAAGSGATNPNTYTLWRTDGTESGTSLVSQVPLEIEPRAVQGLAAVRGILYFSGSRFVPAVGNYRHQLWKSDGTAAGTTMVHADIGAGPATGFTAGPDGKVLFLASGLWETDGTTAGTVRLPSPPSVAGPLVRADNGTVLFAGSDATTGVELWRVDPPVARPPARPTSLALAPRRGQATLSWIDNSGDESGFRVERSATPGFTTIDHAATVPAGTTTYAATGLADGATYHFRVVAFNGAGDSPAATGSIRAPYAPAAPAALTATAVSGGEVTLAWADLSDNETGFRLERSSTADFSTVERTVDLTAGATSFLDQSAQPGTTYHYRVRAVTPFFESAAVAASATTPAAPRAPAAFTAAAISGTRVDLRWTDAAGDETGYRLERSKSATFDTIDRTFVLPARDGIGGTYAFVDDTAARLTTYSYRLRAVNAAGDSGPATASVTTPDVVPPPPSPLSALAFSDTEVLLRWVDNSDNELSFRVERAQVDGPFTEIGTLPAGRVEFTDFSRRPNTVYRYRVRGIGTVGPGPYTDEASATTLPPRRARLVADLNTAPADVDSLPSPVVTSGGVGYFAAYDVDRDRELWRTDGTAAGTWRIKDLDPDGSSEPQYLVDFNGTLLFRTKHGDLWKSDGTAAGTILVRAGVGLPALATEPPWSVPFNGALYFAAGGDLYRTDGTPAGTVLVKSVGISVGSLTPVGNTLYFVGHAPESGAELWKTDGTAAGTALVKEVVPGTAGGGLGSLRSLSGVLLFRATSPDTGLEVWRSDGTAAGTVPVKDIIPGAGGSFPSNIAVVGSAAYFVTSVNGALGLWRTDGSTDGTVFLKAGRMINPVASNGSLYFAVAGADGLTLHRSDGTADGTVPVKLIPNTRSDSGPSDFSPFDVNGTLFFLSRFWRTLWRSDGTADGTVPLHTWDPGGGYEPGAFANYNGALTLAADDGQHGSELWTSDGTVEGTVLVKDVAPFTRGSDPDQFVALGGRAVFTALDGLAPGPGLYASTGTAAGTVRLAAGRSPRAAGDWVYFNGYDPATGWELWRTDGTAAGTSPVAELRAGAEGMRLGNFTAAGATVFFTALADGQSGVEELWKTDGTAAGTVRVSTEVGVRVDNTWPQPSVGPVAVGDDLFFRGTTNTGSLGLWKTDGTAAGTTLVKATSIGELIGFGDVLLFTTGGNRNTLWRSDGTPEGTVMLKGANANSVSDPSISGLTAAGPVAYFLSDEPTVGFALWKTDGTAAGTVPVADVGGYISPVGVVGSTYYFASFDTLYRTDGTAEGTVRVRDYRQESNAPRYGLAAGGRLFYSDGAFLWQTDGTATGTGKVVAVAKQGPQAFSRGPHGVVVGDALYTSGVDPVFGTELVTVALAGVPAAPANLSASPSPDDPFAVRLTWDGRSTDESTFVIERSTSDNFAIIDRSFFPAAAANVFDDTGAAPGVRYYYRVRAANAAGTSEPSRPTARPAAVVGRHVFYNGSAFDGRDSGATAADDGALAAEKRALVAGQAASFRNVSSYVKGINGVIVDLVGLPAGVVLTPEDFLFRRGAGPDPSSWTAGPRPSAVAIRRGAGVNGTDRVTLVWSDDGPDSAVINGWLEVTVVAGARTGLLRPEVFSFGSLVGEAGDGNATSFRVNALDLAAVKRALTATPVGLTAATDFNRDGRINALDLAVVKRALNQTLLTPVLATAFADEEMAEAGRLAEQLGLSSSCLRLYALSPVQRLL